MLRSPLLAAAALLAVAARPARAQLTADTASTELPKGAIAIHGGMTRLDAGAFNDALSTRGRPGLPETAPVAGVETWVRWKHAVLAVSGQAFVQRRAFGTFFDTEFSGGAAQVDLGYPVVATRGFLLWPMVGAGSTRANVALRARGDVSFPDVLVDPARSTDLTAWSWQGHVGVGAVKVITPPRWNVLLTLEGRAGWIAPLGGTDWRSGPWDVRQAPDLAQRGLYVRAGVGLVLAKRGYAIAPGVVTLLPYLLRR